MLQYDKTVPPSLRKTQEWFGSIIERPLGDNSTIAPIAPSGTAIEEEAKQFIAKSPTLNPHERIQIYNQQYWWRLLNTLQEYFPTITRLFGYHDFNTTIAIPYLLKFPPDTWSLAILGKKLPGWVKTYYQAEDRDLVYDAAVLDAAFHALFFISPLPAVTADMSNELLEKKFYLQPHVHLFKHPYDFFSFRKDLNKEPVEHWLDNDFPPLPKHTTYTMLLRARDGKTVWKTLNEAEYSVLEKIQKGITLDKLSTWLEKSPPAIKEVAEKSLAGWFREWTLQGLLTLKFVRN